MQYLPADLHYCLTTCLDESSNLVFPLTCKLLFQNLGQPKFTPRQAVSLAAKDNNLNLMKYFLGGVGKIHSRARRFYNVVVLQPALKGNALHILHWYFQKKYRVDAVDINESLRGINLLTYDLVLTKISRNREHLIHGIFAHDRFDILRERYLNSGYVISDEDILEIFSHDAVNCLHAILLGKKTSEVSDIIPRGLRQGGEKIVRYFVIIWKRLNKGRLLPNHLLDEVLRNHKYNELKSFQAIQKLYTLSEEQILLVLKYKDFPVVELITHNLEITPQHCKAVLERESYLGKDVIEHIFARFSGRLSVHKQIYILDLNLQLLAEKLTSVKCLIYNILSERNLTLFERLLQEDEFTPDDAKMLCTYYNKEMFELYLTYRKLPCQYHLYYYSHIGDEFVNLLEERDYPVSKQVYTRRDTDRIKAQKRKEIAGIESRKKRRIL